MAGRILVLDDEENYAEMLRDLLREHNYRVDMSTKPERALVQLQEIPYDLVISDYKMPVMDGADLLEKSRHLYPDLPFILVSGLMNTPELVKVANMSVTLVMEKPLDTQEFLRQVARFSKPMTEEEKAAYARDSKVQQAGEIPVVYNYPEQPTFFSAGCSSSKEFMDLLWKVGKDANSLLLIEPDGGDAEQALKDLSIWKGNEDRPVSKLKYSQFVDLGLSGTQSVIDDSGFSNLILVQLGNGDSLKEALDLAQVISEELSATVAPMIVCVYSLPIEDAVDYQAVADKCLRVPSLGLRAIDAAIYARRFARLYADRAIKPKCADFTEAAAFEILSHSWPGNYREIQNVISRVILMHENEPLTYPLLSTGFTVDQKKVTCPPEERMKILLERAQQQLLTESLVSEGKIADELVTKCGLSSEVPKDFELSEAPLIRPELVRF